MNRYFAVGAGVGLALGVGFAAATPVRADDATVTYKSLSPDVALEAAQAALKQCRADGFQVAVAVVDRFGEAQVMLRDRFAGLPAPRTATDKAWTALGFRANTSDLSKSIQTGQLDARLASLPRCDRRFRCAGRRQGREVRKGRPRRYPRQAGFLARFRMACEANGAVSKSRPELNGVGGRKRCSAESYN
jgi:hypothetical protein